MIGDASERKVKEVVVREEFYVDSTDGRHMIHGYRWFDPDRKWKGVLQLVHGMMEHIGRYQEFAEYMAENGYYVIGHDHLGHGYSVSDVEELGCVSKEGARQWLKDIEIVHRMGRACAPGLPYIILGHSMGSFLVRRYLIYAGKRVDGAVIMGTGQQNRLTLKIGLGAVALEGLRVGDRGCSTLLDNMACSGYAKKYPDNAKNGSWVSRDPQTAIRSAQDNRMNFRFTVNAYRALFQTIEEIVDPRRVARMPKELPLLVLSGGDDLVGACGKGIRRFERMLKTVGMKKVTCVLYPKNRHELLNELDKELVYQDIRQWCDRVCHERSTKVR